MMDTTDLLALLSAYITGDVLARKVLLDALDEAGDPRLEAVRAEAIDWDALARGLSSQGDYAFRDVSYVRWLIDCARYGSATTRRDIPDAVREARRIWLQGLFPEVNLPQ